METKNQIDVWSLIGYICIALTLGGQIIMGKTYIGGQGLFLISNILFLIRTFVLKRPAADKVKDVCFTSVTVALIILYFLGVF